MANLPSHEGRVAVVTGSSGLVEAMSSSLPDLVQRSCVPALFLALWFPINRTAVGVRIEYPTLPSLS